jgi:hypothetical protein
VKTDPRKPQEVFFSPQQLVVPLFQRPYVWNAEKQWQPLWDDIKRVAERLSQFGRAAPHFLGAVVVQQQPNSTGTLQIRTVIDGQQRLTTLQVFLSAVHAQLRKRDQVDLAKQVQDLIANQDQYTSQPSDVFKVWPTSKDRAAFEVVMRGENSMPSNLKNHKLVQAFDFFAVAIGNWLDEGPVESKARVLVSTVLQHLELVVIDLQADEDAQEIFETLNARGTPLSAADLIKNLVFQRLEVTPTDAEAAYISYWQEFETPFWEKELPRLLTNRSSLFLTQWLIAETQEDITSREVFSRFKRFVGDYTLPIPSLLYNLRQAGDVYKKYITGAEKDEGKLSRLEVFAYRSSTMKSEIFKSVVIWLTNPTYPPIPDAQIEKAINSLESWLVRRSIVRVTSKAYNKIAVELLHDLQGSERSLAGDVVTAYFARQTGSTSYWPSDKEIEQTVASIPLYKRMPSPRLRMIVEALEDFRRGFVNTQGSGLSESPIKRGALSIEHLRPQEWRSHWGLEPGEREEEADTLLHTLGNLTLVTKALNSKASNSAWIQKKENLKTHSTLLMTQDIVQSFSNWTLQDIHSRNESLISTLLELWPVPKENKGLLESSGRSVLSKVSVSDLIQAGFLKAGQTIFARVAAHKGREAVLSESGAIYVDGLAHSTLSAAAKYVAGTPSEDGWWFWVLDLEDMTSMKELRTQFLELADQDESDEQEEDE